MTRLMKFACVPALLALSGCGSGEPAAGQPKVEIERGIFVSATDCAESGKMTLDQCGAVIDQAVALHERQAPSYKTLGLCAAKEGEDRCDKTVDGYRARLQAFLVTIAPQQSAVPLYPSSAGQPGFRSAQGGAVSAADDTMTVSVTAMALANDNGKVAR